MSTILLRAHWALDPKQWAETEKRKVKEIIQVFLCLDLKLWIPSNIRTQMNLKADLSMKLSDLPEFVKTWKWINYLLFIDTSTYAERQYVIPVLSGSAFIGQLYDAKKDQILHDRFLWQSPVAVNEATHLAWADFRIKVKRIAHSIVHFDQWNKLISKM